MAEKVSKELFCQGREAPPSAVNRPLTEQFFRNTCQPLRSTAFSDHRKISTNGASHPAPFRRRREENKQVGDDDRAGEEQKHDAQSVMIGENAAAQRTDRGTERLAAEQNTDAGATL